MLGGVTDVLRSQIDYYDARAGEYDDFWFRRGAYSLDPEQAERWKQDAEESMRFVRENANGAVLELAAGTGIFTAELHRVADSVHAIDASPQMLSLNHQRVGSYDTVTYEIADLFAWQPSQRYETVFFGFWLSHVPDDRFDAFWATLHTSLRPGGRVVMIDSRPRPGSADTERVRVEARRLSDGRSFNVVKRYWTTETLTSRLTALGWSPRVEASSHDLMLRAVVDEPDQRASGSELGVLADPK